MPLTTPANLIDSYAGDTDHFLHVLEDVFMPAVEKAGLEPISPLSVGAENIQADIITSLQTADLVLVDLSTLNPNVFFEFGVRTSLNLPACPIRDDKTPKIPFDTATLNTLTYDSQLSSWIAKKTVPKLAHHIETTMVRTDGKNALWRHFGFKKLAVGPEPPVGDEDRLSALLNEVAALREQVGRLDKRSLESLQVGHAYFSDQELYARLITEFATPIADIYGIRLGGVIPKPDGFTLLLDDVQSAESRTLLESVRTKFKSLRIEFGKIMF
jgi:hypothetical protein